MSTTRRKGQQTQTSPAPSSGNVAYIDFDSWAGAVKRQMLDALRKRGTR